MTKILIVDSRVGAIAAALAALACNVSTIELVAGDVPTATSISLGPDPDVFARAEARIAPLPDRPPLPRAPRRDVRHEAMRRRTWRGGR